MLAAAILIIAALVTPGVSEPVIPLTDDTLESALQANSTPWLLFFTAPDCAQCEEVAGMIDRVADHDAFPVGHLRCSDGGDVQCTRFRATAFPTAVLVDPAAGVMWHYGALSASTTPEDLLGFVAKGHTATTPLFLDNAEIVASLTDDNITLAESGTGTWMVAIISLTCSHCRDLGAAYRHLAAEVYSDDTVRLAALNARHGSLVMKRYRILAYPTILAFKDRQYYVFDGDRTVEKLKAFLHHPEEVAPPRPIPKPDVTIADTLGMLYEEMADVFGEAWSDPVQGPKIQKLIAVSVAAWVLISVVFVVALSWAFRKDPPQPAPAAKKNN